MVKHVEKDWRFRPHQQKLQFSAVVGWYPMVMQYEWRNIMGFCGNILMTHKIVQQNQPSCANSHRIRRLVDIQKNKNIIGHNPGTINVSCISCTA